MGRSADRALRPSLENHTVGQTLYARRSSDPALGRRRRLATWPCRQIRTASTGAALVFPYGLMRLAGSRRPVSRGLGSSGTGEARAREQWSRARSRHIPLIAKGASPYFYAVSATSQILGFNVIQSFVAGGGGTALWLENFRDKIVVVGLTVRSPRPEADTIRSVYPGMAITHLARTSSIAISGCALAGAVLTLAAATVWCGGT